MEIGAEMRKVMVWLRRSSAISRMVNSGVAINSTTAAMANTGATMISVTPGGLAICTSCDWISRKASRRPRKTQASTSCISASNVQASGEANSVFNSLQAMVKIMVEYPRSFPCPG